MLQLLLLLLCLWTFEMGMRLPLWAWKLYAASDRMLWKSGANRQRSQEGVKSSKSTKMESSCFVVDQVLHWCWRWRWRWRWRHFATSCARRIVSERDGQSLVRQGHGENATPSRSARK